LPAVRSTPPTRGSCQPSSGGAACQHRLSRRAVAQRLPRRARLVALARRPCRSARAYPALSYVGASRRKRATASAHHGADHVAFVFSAVGRGRNIVAPRSPSRRAGAAAPGASPGQARCTDAILRRLSGSSAASSRPRSARSSSEALACSVASALPRKTAACHGLGVRVSAPGRKASARRRHVHACSQSVNDAPRPYPTRAHRGGAEQATRSPAPVTRIVRSVLIRIIRATAPHSQPQGLPSPRILLEDAALTLTNLR